MLGISINFAYPYLLLLIIAFVIATFIPYFMVSKKYRNTRNRIVSIFCHLFASVLAVLMLSGMTFVNTNSNPNNEIILVVDVSDSSRIQDVKRDQFVETVVDSAKFDNFRIGVVVFGFDQKYVAPLSNDYNKIISQYKSSVKRDNDGNLDIVDTSGTDVAAALVYAKSLFTNPNYGKIVLVTDGIETDEYARAVIRTVVASGIKLDTAYIGFDKGDNLDLQVTDLKLPEYHINVNNEFSLIANVDGDFIGEGKIDLYDNDTFISSTDVNFTGGEQNITLKHTFTNDGLHNLKVKITVEDYLVQNNEYSTYLYLEQYNKLLIIEQNSGESELLKNVLEENDMFEVSILNVYDNELPKTIDDLCNYDEIIMNNIANSDLNSDFVELLNEYVSDYGGGLFTTGGKDSTDNAHSYNRSDMVGTLYQQMLPVQAIDYKPPVGVIVIIDRSGSMGSADSYGETLLDYARAGAESCLKALTERDYFGLMTLDSDYNTILEPTPVTQRSKILSGINSIQDATGGTVFPGAIDRAGQALRALKVVDKKHIIIVTDGQVPNSDMETYETYARNYYETDGITISVVGVQMDRPTNYKYLEDPKTSIDECPDNAYGKMLRLTKITHGTLHPTNDSDRNRLITEMREDLKSPDIQEVNYKDFNPNIVDMTSSIFSNISVVAGENSNYVLDFQLKGFYGTKVRGSADLLLTGDYNVPIYAQWKYGKGTVGSFMCDLYGEWSLELLESDDGKQLLKNIVSALTPIENIKTNDIKLSLVEDNYFNTMSVFTKLNEGEYLKASVNYSLDGELKNISLSDFDNKTDGAYPILLLNADNNYSRAKFVLKDKTAYEIVVNKYSADGSVIASNTIYKSLSYSKEYDLLDSSTDYSAVLTDYAKIGQGNYIKDLNDPHEIIDSFDVNLVSTFDPRILFSILIIILFLIDFAVRKFKFRWPHEIIRDHKNRKI